MKTTDVQNGLVAVLGVEDIFDLLERDIDAQEMRALLHDRDFSRLRPETLCEVVVEDSLIRAGLPFWVSEAEVKLRGEKWTIHRYDADPFPSNPHAHNYAQRLKLHLGNGDVYEHKSKISSARMQKKHLLRLRELISQQNASIILPPLMI